MIGAIYDANLRTHIKIVLTALIAAIVVLAIGIGARLEPKSIKKRPVGGIPAPSRIVRDDMTPAIPVSALPARGVHSEIGA